MSAEEQNQLNRLMAKKKRYEEQEEAVRKAGEFLGYMSTVYKYCCSRTV